MQPLGCQPTLVEQSSCSSPPSLTTSLRPDYELYKTEVSHRDNLEVCLPLAVESHNGWKCTSHKGKKTHGRAEPSRLAIKLYQELISLLIELNIECLGPSGELDVHGSQDNSLQTSTSSSAKGTSSSMANRIGGSGPDALTTADQVLERGGCRHKRLRI